MMNNKDTFSISEVAEYTGFKPHVIRFYEKEFDLNIPRAENSRRYFTEKEIQQLKYIQKLQSDGFNNKQIKVILNNEETKNSTPKAMEEVAITSSEKIDDCERDTAYILMELKNEMLRILEEYNYKNEINELRERIDDLTQRLGNGDKDVLICENAKLKLKLKEKSYEVAELKDKLKRQESQKAPLFQRLLKAKSV